MNVILYKRVSTETQKEKGFSLRHQDEILRKYCEFKNYNIVGAYVEDHSAKDFENRPEFQKLMTFVKANKKTVDLILFTRWDRYSRNLEMAWRNIRELKVMGVGVQAIEQPLDLENADNKVMLALYLIGPEVENDKISARTIAGLLRARKEGAWPSKAPFGYNCARNEDEKATIVPNEKSYLVIEAFEEVAKNVESVDSIRRRMNSKGLKLCKQAFQNMLRNVAYLGKVIVPAYQKDDGFIVDGLHEAIITEEVFYRVQDVIKGRKRGDTIPSHKNESFPLRNYLICGVCGQNLNGSKSRGRSGAKYAYYHCRKRCPTYVPEPLVDQRFVELLASLTVGDNIIELFAEILKDVYGKNEKEMQSKILRLLKEKEELNSMIENAEDRLVRNDISSDTCDRISKRLNNQLMNINNEIEQLKEKKDNPVNYLSKARQVLSSLDQLYLTLPYELKRVLVCSIFPEKVIVSNEECRTTMLNEVVVFLTRIDGGSRALRNQKATNNGGLSSMAPSAGLEPATL